MITLFYIKTFTGINKVCHLFDKFGKLIKFNDLYCIHTKKLSCLRSGVEFDMNDIFYEFKYLHHFLDSLTFGVNAVLVDKTGLSPSLFFK